MSRTSVRRSQALGDATRRRAGLFVRSVGGTALVIAGVAGCTSGSSTQSSPSPATSATGVASPSTGTSSNAPGISLPDRIATLTKSADQSIAQGLLQQLGSVPGAKITAISYEDSTDKTHAVLIFGGTGLPVPPGDVSTQLNSMIRSGTATDAKIDPPVAVDPGASGGTAGCAGIPSEDGRKFVNCGWINGNAALVMSFTGFELAAAEALVPQIIAAART
jgi:hypothetical protein